LQKYDDETIKNHLFKRDFNKALALLFKYFNDENKLLEKLHDIFLILKDYISNPEKQEDILEFILYIMSISDIKENNLINIIITASELQL